MRNIDDLMRGVSIRPCKGLPDYELNINRWLKDVFRVLRVGGSEARRTFRKVSSVHFVEIHYEEE